jgi:hypothetical protein
MISALEDLVRANMEIAFGITGGGEFIWSMTDDFYYFKYEHTFCWKNANEQRYFWEVIVRNCSHEALLANGACIIDLTVYQNNYKWPCIQSNFLTPIDVTLPWEKYFVTVGDIGEFFDYPEKPPKTIRVPSDKPPRTLVELSGLLEEESTPADEWGEEFILKIIEEKIPNVELSNMVNPTSAYLKTVGERYCIINGELSLSDNCYLNLEGNNVVFRCRDAGCADQSKVLYTFGEEDSIEFDADNDLSRADEGFSDIFVGQERSNIQVVDTQGTCYIWSDKTKLWEQHHKGWISNRISTTLEDVIIEVMESESDENELKKLRSSCKYVLSTGGARNIMQKVLPKLENMKFIESLNSNPDLLPIKNGKVVNLKTGEIRSRTRVDLFSFECPVSICKSSAQIAKVDQFMLSIANDNEELKQFLQKQLGYFLTGHTHERCFFLWWGHGSNGKATIFNEIDTFAKTVAHISYIS